MKFLASNMTRHVDKDSRCTAHDLSRLNDRACDFLHEALIKAIDRDWSEPQLYTLTFGCASPIKHKVCAVPNPSAGDG